MVHVSTIFPVEDLERAIDEGWVRRQSHPTLPLFIYNYSENAQFSKHWNRVTLNCRGLILDADYNIVARPWKKFFNLGEGFYEIDMTMPVEVTDKVDGSLGILYAMPAEWKFNGGNTMMVTHHAIATRGSFASDQAMHATDVWDDRYAGFVTVPEDYTFLFEIVYPANRIVLNYGDMDDLVLLGAVNNKYGYYYGPNEAAGLLNWPGPVTEVFTYRTMQEAFDNNTRPNAEGYVVRSGQSIIKLKQTDYVELHKIVTNLNERTIWEQLGQGKSIDEVCAPLPDEFHAWATKVYRDLTDQAQSIEGEILAEYLAIEPGLDRKSFAMIASRSKFSGYLFKLYDGKPIYDDVWKTLKPKVDKT